MKLNPLIAVIFGTMLILLTSCRTSPVYNVPNQNFVTNKADYTIEDVKKSIIRAGATLGWSMNANKPGHIIATLNIRDHMAQIEINYDLKKYNIKYKDSSNLKYDEVNTEIHSNYNGWIQNLDRGIRTQLNTL